MPLRNDVFSQSRVASRGRPASVALINAVQKARWSSGCCPSGATVESPREDLFEVGTYASIISVMQTNTDRFQVMGRGWRALAFG